MATPLKTVYSRITKDTEVCGGRACIHGTRIRVVEIACLHVMLGKNRANGGMRGMPKAWQEVRSLLRAAGPAGRASSMYGRALKLDKKGKTHEAFVLTKKALDSLKGQGMDQASPPILSVMLVMTVFLAQLSAKLGNPSAADDAARKALQLASPFDHDPKIREYTEWLRYRLGNS